MAEAQPMTARTTADDHGATDLPAILRAVGAVAYAWDVASDRLSWSDGVHETLGLPVNAAIDTATGFAGLFDPEALMTRREAVFGSKTVDQGQGVAFEVEYPLTRGPREKRLWVQDRGRWYAGPDGRPSRVVGVVRELGARHEAAAQVASLSRFDMLTGQLTRPRLIEIAGAALAAGLRMQTATAFALVALTNLGAINEAYGFDVGDLVIVEVSRRLRASMRGGDTLGRFSTSTFGMVLQECDGADLEVAAARLWASIHDEPVLTPAGLIAVRIALGAVVAPRHARSVEEMITRARTALARAMESPAALSIYAPDPERDGARRANMKLADDLVVALKERRVLLAYQPVARAATGEICWSEALARIITASGEAVSGGPLAEAAEEVGLVHMLDRRALDIVIARLAGDQAARAAVNVSAATVGDRPWSQALDAWLTLRPDIAPRLVVEITETAAIRDLSATRDFVAELKARGVRVAIDDFGAGHTSFKALRELKVDLVKIDGSFVQDLETSPESGAFVRALLALSRELGFETVAEKVESEAVATLLRDWGATYLQGDFVGPPVIG
jgi:diguanylate cyclase (GGDEF)-like protein